LKIHEYQAKELFKDYDINIPEGYVGENKDEILKIYKSFDDDVVLKVQVHAGGRGKAGGVRLVKSEQEVIEFAEKFFGKGFQTIQTENEEFIVNKILVEKVSDINSESYIALLVDGSNQSLNIIASPEGGMDIEEVASKSPENILTLPINVITGPTDFQIRKINNFLRYEQTYYGELRKIIRNLYELYLSKDCSLIEINPLIQNKSGEILALDAKITFDEDALFRQNLIKELRDLSQENPVEIETAKLGIKYIQLQGSVGCIVNGAGLAMATMDVINVSGLKPANFLDIGGGADENKVSEAMLAVLSDQNVEVVLINLFGGILRCDVAARGFLSALDKYNKKAPELIIRMLGTNSDKGKEILSASKYNISFADNLNEISKILITKR
tara:strand:+ start:65 stop:1222 length:1158 start_codon:yes stop_codon:yes gene_type:complete